MATTHQVTRTTQPICEDVTHDREYKQGDETSISSISPPDGLSASGASTPTTPISLSASDVENKLQDIKHYIALGCLHFDHEFNLDREPMSEDEWLELQHLSLIHI